MGFKTVVAGATVSMCAISSAIAGGLTEKDSLKDTPYVEVSGDWSGFYAGWTLGGGSGSSKNYVSGNNNAAHGWASNDPDGVLIGGTIGYNWRYTQNWVFGVEGDFAWSGLEGDQKKYIYDGHEWSGGWDAFGTIRGRVGYAVGHNLFYGTGGIAFVHSNEQVIGNDADESNSGRGWYTGFVVGGGWEHAFTSRLSAKLEYLHAGGFDDKTGTTGTVSQQGDQSYIHRIGDIDIVRAGLNYKLN